MNDREYNRMMAERFEAPCIDCGAPKGAPCFGFPVASKGKSRPAKANDAERPSRSTASDDALVTQQFTIGFL